MKNTDLEEKYDLKTKLKEIITGTMILINKYCSTKFSFTSCKMKLV